TAVKWGGAAVLCWMAWEGATARRSSPGATGQPVGLAGAAAFQWINPKSWLVCARAAPTLLDTTARSPAAPSAPPRLPFFLAVLPSCLPWLAFGAVIQRFLTSERAFRIFSAGMGALLAASVILFFR